MGGSPSELSEDLLTQKKRKKGWRMNCGVGEATEVLQPFFRFSYVIGSSLTSPGELPMINKYFDFVK